MEIWKAMTGSLVRVGIAWAFGILVSNKIINEDLAANLTDSAVGYVLLFLLAIAPVAWSYLQKRYAYYLFKYALHSPVHTTEAEVEQMVKLKQPPPMPL